MKKFLTTLAALTVIATPAFAQSFCTCDGTGNVLKFTNNPITYQNQAPAIPAIGPSGLHAFAMAQRTRSAHVTPHKEGAAQTQVSREGIFEFYGIDNTSVPGASIDKDDTTPKSK